MYVRMEDCFLFYHNNTKRICLVSKFTLKTEQFKYTNTYVRIDDCFRFYNFTRKLETIVNILLRTYVDRIVSNFTRKLETIVKIQLRT